MFLAPGRSGVPLSAAQGAKKTLQTQVLSYSYGHILASRNKKPTAVSDLLARAPGALARLREGTQQAEKTLAALQARLPADMARQVWGASLKDGTLTVLVRSAAWGTRLRYLAPQLLEPLAADLGAPVEGLKVKVRAPPAR